ncbi:hypothetical protein GCM10010302_70570 [Streptomyces polychromogenes]|uniref:Uncharacterized protein n=1 Tax=Streptomyces polychromogenes TaxID=67342 RepID=A0ABN0VZK6_9ACTN
MEGPRGTSGSDWVDPGTTGTASARAGVESESGSARAAAVTTPIEEARNPRMEAMLGTPTTKRHRRTDAPSDGAPGAPPLDGRAAAPRTGEGAAYAGAGERH